MAVPLNRRDGAYFGTLCALDPAPSALNEEKIGVMKLLSNLISFELEAEEQHQQQAAALLDAQEASRFREQLMATIGHDLRTPITAIGLSAQLLQHDEALTEEQRELVDTIGTSASRSARMIDQLLDFTRARLSREIPLTRRPADLAEILDPIVQELRRAQPMITFHLALSGDLSGDWDVDRLARVVVNLAANAAQYGTPGRAVSISAAECGDAVTIEVHNEGTPIPPETAVRIFEPYERASDAGGGIGLGLYIVRRIVDAHHGTIAVESSSETGTLFRIVLPRVATDAVGT